MMRHSFRSLTKVSKAYIVCLQKYPAMEFDDVFKWVGYAALGMVVLWFLIDRCWKFCKNRFMLEGDNLEIFIPSTCSTSSSFTYMASVKPDYSPPMGANDGLSDFESSIMFDQPMTLSSSNPYCKQKAEKGYSASEGPEERSSTSVIGRIGPLDDDLQSIHNIVNVFNKSVLSLSLDGYDNMYGGLYCMDRGEQNTTESIETPDSTTNSCVTQYSADTDVESQSIVQNPQDSRLESVIVHCEIITDV